MQETLHFLPPPTAGVLGGNFWGNHCAPGPEQGASGETGTGDVTMVFAELPARRALIQQSHYSCTNCTFSIAEPWLGVGTLVT